MGAGRFTTGPDQREDRIQRSRYSRSLPYVSSRARNARRAMIIVPIPTVAAAHGTPSLGFSAAKLAVSGTTAPRTKLGAVVVAVARTFVPNCSDATVTKTAQ